MTIYAFKYSPDYESGYYTVSLHKTQKSGDGTPRYVVNPNSPDNTYSIEGCINSGFKPIYS